MAGKNTIVKLYNLFTGEELRIAELIQRRRLQILVHSYLYYELDTNLITDSQWYDLSKELMDLQRAYPQLEKKVPFREGFEDWDGSTGAFLPLNQLWLRKKAYLLMNKVTSNQVPKKNQSKRKTTDSGKKRLF